MKTRLMKPCAMALALTGGLLGCQQDNAAVDAMKELTAQLSATLGENNTKIETLSKAVTECEKEIATVKGEAAVIEASTQSFDVPQPPSEGTLEALETFKQTLTDATTKQKTAISDLESKAQRCKDDLATAREEAEEAAKAEEEAAAAAEAAEAAKKAEEEAAAKKKSRKKKSTKKKTAFEEKREAEGRPTTGTGSRFRRRTQ